MCEHPSKDQGSTQLSGEKVTVQRMSPLLKHLIPVNVVYEILGRGTNFTSKGKEV